MPTPTASTGLAPTRAAAGPVSRTCPEWVQGELCAWTRQRLQVQQLLCVNVECHKSTAIQCHFFFLVAGCSSGLSAETKGVYVLFFLLSALIVMLLVAAGMLYRRHHRGAFLVHCQKTGSISSHKPKKEGSFCPNAELPPPPLPSRGYREAWPPLKEGHPPVDLPLLRFNPLLPPEDAK